MNKKLLTFAFMSVLFVAIGSAMLVNYLSNTQEVEVSVSSPLEISEIIGDEISVYGGETSNLQFDLTNNANVDINAKVEITIHSSGISKEDFQSIITEITEGSWTSGEFDALTVGGMIESVEVVGNNIVITSTEQPWQTGKGAWHFDADLKFAQNSLGDYSVSVKAIQP